MKGNAIEVSFEKTVQYLFSQLPMFQRDGNSAYKKDLTNTLQLCEFLGNPQHQFKSVHVAGTNGKGSSSHYLASVFQEAGYKTGLYTSPHLKSFTERIRINGIEISKEFVVDFVEKIKPIIRHLAPSFFEITVAMCFDYFARKKVDIGIIEVGMGGRLDSTNVILPEVSLITNISLDHQKWLGNSVVEIAGEKSGIIKPNRPIVISESDDLTKKVFKARAAQSEAPIYFADNQYRIESRGTLNIYKKDELRVSLSTTYVPKYQMKNLKGVVYVVEVLNKKGFTISNEALKLGLENSVVNTGFKGRWQQLGKNPDIFCDVGHNEEGIDHVIKQISSYTFDQLHFVLGVVDDKELNSILSKLPQQAIYYFCQAGIPRALSALELSKKASEVGLEGVVVPDVNKAIERAKSAASKTDFIFIGGSNFVVAEIKDL